MPIRRQLKNVVNNFSDSQVKVREATSNDPWGPSSSLMTEIADLTYNVVAFSEIMAMVWKRLNDHGKNWRHVYKSLVLLDYIIKTGSERVAQQCKENIFAIQTLKDFQFVDRDGKDQGVNVREKSKQLVALLKDDERLKQERARALKAKERFAQASSGIGSDTNFSGGGSTSGGHPETADSYNPTGGTETDIQSDLADPSSIQSTTPPSGDLSEMEQARPTTTGEEELQLQLALAMSKEEADEAERQKRSDDVRLQMALNESLDRDGAVALGSSPGAAATGSALLDLADPVPGAAPALPTADPWASEPAAPPAVPADPWGAPAAAAVPVDPWSNQPRPPAPLPQQTPAPDPWSSPSTSRPTPPPPSDPWGAGPPAAASNNVAPPAQQSASLWGEPPAAGAASDLDADFDSLRTDGLGQADMLGGPAISSQQPFPSQDNNLFDMGGMSQSLPPMDQDQKKKSPSDFLGENSSLVNLDSLIGPTPQQQITQGSMNPFAVNTASKAANPFQQQTSASPTLNQMRAPPTMGEQHDGMQYGGGMQTLPQPLLPTGTSQPPPQQSTNPFLL